MTQDITKLTGAGEVRQETRATNCQKCGQPLTEIHYPSDSMLNRDQWASQLPGDLFCTCHNNNRGNKPYAYFWKSEFAEDSASASPEPAAHCEHRPSGYCPVYSYKLGESLRNVESAISRAVEEATQTIISKELVESRDRYQRLVGMYDAAILRAESAEAEVSRLREALGEARLVFFYIKNLSKNAWQDLANIEAICRRINEYARDSERRMAEALRVSEGSTPGSTEEKG